MSVPSTAYSVSADSGEYWAARGAWEVEPGIYRIPLPLPMDGLTAVNVYAISTASGLTLIDGGWAILEAREVLEGALASVGFRLEDVTQFLVTHAHRDHYTLASVLGAELGSAVLVGADEKGVIDLVRNPALPEHGLFYGRLVEAGAPDLARQWRSSRGDLPDPAVWMYPSRWLAGDESIDLGSRCIDAIHTPGHTAGHYVFADRRAGVLFTGDHVLPTITPSIGFTLPALDNPLGDFLDSLAKIRSLSDLKLLPAHGPVARSTHTRIDELVSHHEARLRHILAETMSRPKTSLEVAEKIPWTRHLRNFHDLGLFDQGLAVMETRAHLDHLVAQGLALCEAHGGARHYHGRGGTGDAQNGIEMGDFRSDAVQAHTTDNVDNPTEHPGRSAHEQQL